MDADAAKKKISKIHSGIKLLETEIKDIELAIKESGYNEPTSCMKCDWTGIEPERVEETCPRCGEICETTDWIKYKYYE